MNSLYLTRITIGHAYGEAPNQEADKRALLQNPQTHKYMDKTFEGDLRELVKAARHLIGSLDEQGIKPAGISALRAELAKFNLDGPKY